MDIIAESGATKTDWRILEPSGAVESITTEGINPFHQSHEEILSIVRDDKLREFSKTVRKIHFYGAGCNYPDKVSKVESCLRQVFPHSDVFVTHDLLAAARASCGEKPGIACILGTGSNSCYYNGSQIIATSPSLGYILGDEGSGAFLGKRLVQDFLFKKTPKSIWEALLVEFGLNISDVLERIYSRPAPHKFLSSFAPFIHQHIDHPYMHGLVYESFYEFMDKHLRSFDQHKDVEINFVGSIAHYFQDILEKVLIDGGLKFGVVVKSPITGLVKFHQKN